MYENKNEQNTGTKAIKKSEKKSKSDKKWLESPWQVFTGNIKKINILKSKNQNTSKINKRDLLGKIRRKRYYVLK